MLFRFHLIAILLAGAIVLTVALRTPLRKYYIRRDYFSGFKANEHAVYDPSGKHLHYRVETRYAFLQEHELVVYPAKQMIGRLKAKLSPLRFNAAFSILDAKTNRWTNGTMKDDLQFIDDVFTITYDEKHDITLKHGFASLTYEFFDGRTDYVLARYRLRPASVLWTRKYDMDVFSDKYPEGIYFLVLSARDHIRNRKSG